MIGHTAMSLIVFYAVWKKQDVKGILACLALHTLLDAGSGLIMGATGSLEPTVAYGAVYGFLTVMAAIFVIMIVKIKKNWKEKEVSV